MIFISRILFSILNMSKSIFHIILISTYDILIPENPVLSQILRKYLIYLISQNNFKITMPIDLELAKIILKNKK